MVRLRGNPVGGRVYPIGPNDCEKQLDALMAQLKALIAPLAASREPEPVATNLKARGE